MEKNLPAMRDTWIQSSDWEDPLEKEMAIYLFFFLFCIFTWRISQTEKPGGLKSTGSQRVGHDQATNAFTLKGNKQLVIETFFNVIIKRIRNMKYSGISLTKFFEILCAENNKAFLRELK